MDNEHYILNHHKSPHEILVRGVNPLAQQKEPIINQNAYIILYVLLVFGLIVLGLFGLAYWLELRRNAKRDEEERFHKKGFHEPDDYKNHDKNRLYPNPEEITGNLYPNPDFEEEKSSMYDGSMVTTTTTEIQPKAPPVSCEKLDEMSRKSSNFGIVNIHHQQSSSVASTESEMYNDGNQQVPNSSSAPMVAPVGLARKHLSKMESFPFEEYGMPENERERIKVRVSDLKSYDNYFHLTHIDNDLIRDESIQEEESEHDRKSSNSNESDEQDLHLGRFESRATLPLRSSIPSEKSSAPPKEN